jgi:hypothetical protein
VILLLEGEEVDVFDDGALLAAIERRTDKVLARLNSAEAAFRERKMLSSVTFIALKAGALAGYHSVRPGEPISIDHVVEVAQQLGQLVGLNLAVEQQPSAPQIIVPPGALEGDDSDSEDE